MADETDDKVRSAISNVLTTGETIVAVASQNAINSPLSQDSAVVTNRRFIIYRPKLMGRMDLEDFLWQDVTDIRISSRLLGSDIAITAKRKDPDGTVRTKSGTVEGLRKADALRLYAEAQRFEEEWREKNRVRQMEEDRARSGGVYLGGAAGTAGPVSAASGASIEQRLAKLKELHAKGLVTDAEYEARKAQIISEL